MPQLTPFFGRHADICPIALMKFMPLVTALGAHAPGFIAAQPEMATETPVARIGACRGRRKKRGKTGNKNGA